MPTIRLPRFFATVTALVALGFTAPSFATPTATDGQQFKDWVASCPKVEGSDEVRCFIFQNLSIRESNQPVLSIRVGIVRGTEQPAALLTVPLGVFLPVGMEVRVDAGEPTRVAYQVCNQGGCIAALPLDEARIKAFKSGQKANVKFEDGRRQPVTVPVSLSGFTAGFEALR